MRKLNDEAEGQMLSSTGLSPKVAILLCTFHGQHYLADQLDSFAAQTHTNWEVWASDDGSLDDTHSILESYSSKWGQERISIHSGPAEGFVANFLSLTCSNKWDQYKMRAIQDFRVFPSVLTNGAATILMVAHPAPNRLIGVTQ